MKFKLILLFYFIISTSVFSQNKPMFINYGKESPLTSGDDNFIQAYFIKVPENYSNFFTIRLFDPDCGGNFDQEFIVHNTITFFELFGGEVLPNEEELKSDVSIIEQKKGSLLKSKIYNDNYTTDGQWVDFAEVSKIEGQLKDGYYYYKLLVTGTSGNDGNVFDISVSGDNSLVEIFSYSPTLRNTTLNKIAQIKFKSTTDNLSVFSFDIDNSLYQFETNLRSNIELIKSGNGKWSKSNVTLQRFEKNDFLGINFGRLIADKNDATFYVKDANGYSLPLTIPNTFREENNKPIIDIKVSNTSLWNKKVFDASRTADFDRNDLEYTWYFDNGDIKKGIKFEYTYADSKYPNGVLLVKDNSNKINNSSLKEFRVDINSPPVADAGEDIFVSKSTVTFNAEKSKDIDGRIIAYKWNFGDGNFSTGKVVNHTYTSPGNYNVTLTVSDNSNQNNNTTSTSLNVQVNHRPIADAGPDKITEPNKPILFDGSNSVDPDGEIAEFHWDFGDGSTSNKKSVEHTYSTPGSYNVSLTVKDNSGHLEALDIDHALIRINSKPEIQLVETIILAPIEEFTFSPSQVIDIDNTDLNYSWTFSDNNLTSNNKITKRSFDKPGFYTAKLKVMDAENLSNSYNEKVISIIVNNPPIPDAGNNILTCNSNILFDASNTIDEDGDILTYTWNFGDGSSKVNGKIVKHEYKEKGTYPVTLTVNDGKKLSNSIVSKSISVVINQPPVADAGSDLIICAGEFVPFDGGESKDPENGLLNYTWDFGDGTSANGVNPIKKYLKGGIYQVKLTVEDDSGLKCNTDTDTKVITVIESPIANAGNDFTACANQEVTFDGSKSSDPDGVVNSFTWDFGDGNTGSGMNPKHTYKQPGKYNVILSITGDSNGDCDNTSVDEIVVTIKEGPEANFKSLSKAPMNELVLFDASSTDGKSSNVISYKWDFGDGIVDSGKIVNHKFTKPGMYVVKLVAITDSKTNCNTSTYSKSILINQSPIANAGKDIQVFTNEYFQLSGLESEDKDGSITNYEWLIEDGRKFNGAVTELKFNNPGDYNITLTVKDNTDLSNNYDTDLVKVSVIKRESLSIYADKYEVCVDDEISFSSSLLNSKNNLKKLKWIFGDGNSAKGERVNYNYNKKGTYIVTAIHESDNVTLTENIEINVNDKPDFYIPSTIYTCKNETILVEPFSNNKSLSYTWTINSSQINGDSFSHRFINSGNHTVKVTAQDNSTLSCNTTTKEFEVIVNSPPIANAGGNKEGFTGGAYDEILFDASNSSDPDGDPLTYTWDFGNGDKLTGKNVFYTFNKVGNYKVTLTVTDGKANNCNLSTDQILVTIKNR